ncbi:hypothetical protein ABZ957_11755 [Streptomyces sp. NPDC046316]
MAEITRLAHVSCVKDRRRRSGTAAAKYRRLIAEKGGFAEARCASDAT